MNEWLEFVSSHSNSPSTSGVSMVAMTEHRLLQVSGRDAVTFLQGQLTCDVRRLAQQDVLLGAHCNSKGRMISSFTLATSQTDSVGLRVRANIAEPALAALKKYIVFSKATITASSQVAIGLLGDNLGELPLGELPARGQCQLGADMTLLHHHSGLLEVWAEPQKAMELWQQLMPRVHTIPTNVLERHWVEHGIAEVQAATTEEFIPQMFNYHLTDGISFKKGCYTGQEIVARMQYKGQLKKHIHRISSSQSEGPTVGVELCGSETQKAAAVVVASAAGNEGWTGLVVAAADAPLGVEVLEDKNSGAKFTWSKLPYAIP